MLFPMRVLEDIVEAVLPILISWFISLSISSFSIIILLKVAVSNILLENSTMEEKEEANKAKPKYNKYNNNNKRIETLEDLCHLLRNKTNQLYGDDELMISS
jgi:hypothetical protein